MHGDTSRVKLDLWKIMNIALITLVFYLGWKMYYNHVITAEFQWKGNLVMVLVFAALYFIFAKIYEAFAIGLQRKLSILFSQALSVFFADCISYVLIFILAEKFVSVLPLLLMFAGQLTVIFVWVILVYKWYFHAVAPKKAIIVHDGSSEIWRLHRELTGDRSYELTDVMNLYDGFSYETRTFKEADAVFICCERSDRRDELIKICAERSVQVMFIPTVADMLLNSSTHVHMFHLPIMSVQLDRADFAYLFVKRAVDIVISAAAILILWPIMLITAAIVKLQDGGPAIYKQKRLTKNGKVFELYKFRSMRVDAEADGVARLSTGDKDDRITPFGRFMRKCRLDELPQIFNIFSGSMSIVGPRPERPEIAAQYEKSIPEFYLRLQAKAGLTGYAQVYGTYSTTPADKLQLDLMYIANPSIIEDVRIMFATVKILFMKESTEGFESYEGNGTENNEGRV